MLSLFFNYSQHVSPTQKRKVARDLREVRAFGARRLQRRHVTTTGKVDDSTKSHLTSISVRSREISILTFSQKSFATPGRPEVPTERG